MPDQYANCHNIIPLLARLIGQLLSQSGPHLVGLQALADLNSTPTRSLRREFLHLGRS